MPASQMNTGLPEVGEAGTVERFCRTCVFFHEDRVRFLPDEASEVVPPACYFRGRVMGPGWCHGAQYQEDIP